MPKHQLIIMRHGKSDWSEQGKPDFERPLTMRGRKAAEKMAKWLKRQYRADRILCSPALRAKQTCQFVVKHLKLSEQNIIWEPSLYEASVEHLTAAINTYSKDIHSLLLIGHNPGLDQLLCYLSQNPPPVSDSGKILTTAAVAVLDYGAHAITTKPHCAALECLVRPKELDLL
ncbi:MAG: phosphohistidine phosphatase SixA [Nitrosomonas sp.]|nr:MAG: phosphohistidine phosphatase SixA [Nitrosomonas sp.]